MLRETIVAILLLVMMPHLSAADPSPLLDVAATVEFGPDRGQNFGTLFEVVDGSGRVIAGAGFMGSYNTQPRSDRERLQVFVCPPGVSRSWEVERLPRIDSPATGFYPFCMNGHLYIHNRSENGRLPTDPKVYRWSDQEKKWIGEPELHPYSERVAGKTLAVTGEAVIYDGKTLLEPVTGARFAEHYFASGNLFIKEANRETTPPLNRVIVCPWTPESDQKISRKEEWTLELPIPFEFIYAFGQWRNEVIVVSNNGRVLRFDRKGWKTLRAPVPNVSYQIYAALNYHDRLLLGHYPTGEIYEYNGGELKLLRGWPPALPGVSSSARETQTLSIYGGELYAGVWPWGEVWRFDRHREQWAFADRMFQHPMPQSAVVHPYESETKRVDAVANLWGQRITGLVPHEAGFIITTSSKGSGPWDPKFNFLSEKQRADYGAIYRVTVPGNLAVAASWKPSETRFEVKLAGRTLTVSQDGQSLGSIPIPESMITAFRPAKVIWGQGVFGPFTGKWNKKSAVVQTVAAPRPWRATYMHLDRIVPRDADEALATRVIDRVLDQAQQAGINIVLPYASGSSGQAYYPSQKMPVRHYATLDPVALVVKAARARGMATFPVMCVTVCGNETPSGILLTHPEWGLRHPDGKPLGYISPANPEARAWLASVARELAERYRPDGILLDYIRYHNRPLRLDPAAEIRLENSLPKDASDEEKTLQLQSLKEASVTTLVKEISRAVRSAQPDIAVAAYCWGPHTLSKHLTAQVWTQWVEHGDVDLINISGYYHHSKYGDPYMTRFEKQLGDAFKANESLSRRATLTFALGMKTSHGSVRSAEDVRKYLQSAERIGLNGVAFFTWDTLVPYLDELRAGNDISGAFVIK